MSSSLEKSIPNINMSDKPKKVIIKKKRPEVSSLIKVAEAYKKEKPKSKIIPTKEEIRAKSKKALAFNRRMIKEGKTNKYLIKDEFINLATKRINKTVPSGYTQWGNVIAPTSDDYVFSYINNASENTWNQDNNINNNYLIPNLIQSNKISGNYIIKIIKGGKQIFNRPFNIDNDFWKENRDIFIGSESGTTIYNDDLNAGEKVVIIFTKEKLLPKKYYEQKFLDAKDTHCFFQPMLVHAKNTLETTKSKGVKTRYNTWLNKLQSKPNTSKRKDRNNGHIGYIEKYKDGIPESELQKVIEDLQIAVKIYQPIGSNQILLDMTSKKKPVKVFNYLNTRLNHLESGKIPFSFNNLFTTIEVTEFDTMDELQEKADELREKKEVFIYIRNSFGITNIQTTTERYSLKNDFKEKVKKFEVDYELDYCSYDSLRYPEMHEFITRGTHFNQTVDFEDTSIFEIPSKCIPEDIIHIDMTRAFTQFPNCKWYSGFMIKITDFRQVDNCDQQGFYYITNLVINDSRLNELNDKLGWFYSNNIYTKAELDALKSFGATFDITCGAFGVGSKFQFPEYMNEKVEYVIDGGLIKNVPYYSKWTGMAHSANNNFSFLMDGDDKLFNRFNIPEHEILFNNTTARISYDKKTAFTKRHIAGQIYAYQRLIMLQQLLKMDLDSLVRVCVDGIYTFNHEFDIHPCFTHKDKMTFKNSPCSDYLSSIEKESINICNPVTHYKLAKKREFFRSELWNGAGGSGKTYTNLFLDTGLIDICYVAPSWKLASRMAKDYKEKTGYTLPVQVHHNFLKMPYCEKNLKKYGVIIWDECSMTTEYEKNFLLNNCNSKIIFCGDIGYQLPPVISKKDQFFENKYEERQQLRDDGLTDSKEYKNVCSYLTQMNTTDIENIIECRKNYRFKCNELKKVIAIVRNNINRKINYRKLNIQEVSRNDIDYDYKNDIILVSRHEYNEEYKKKYAELPKYKSISNSFGFKNGEILFTKEKGTEFRHGFTVHSVQGETFEGKIFIDMRNIDDNQMFYTAISRARFLNQIYLIV